MQCRIGPLQPFVRGSLGEVWASEVYSEVCSSLHTLSTVQSAPLFVVIYLASIQSIVLSISIFGGPGVLGEVSEVFLGVMQVPQYISEIVEGHHEWLAPLGLSNMVSVMVQFCVPPAIHFDNSPLLLCTMDMQLSTRVLTQPLTAGSEIIDAYLHKIFSFFLAFVLGPGARESA